MFMDIYIGAGKWIDISLYYHFYPGAGKAYFILRLINYQIANHTEIRVDCCLAK